MIWSPSTTSPCPSTASIRSPSPSNATPRSRLSVVTSSCSARRSVAPQPTLMFEPSGVTPIAWTSAPQRSKTPGAIPENAPFAQSTPMRRPERSDPKCARTWPAYSSRTRSRLSTEPPPVAGASSSASICSSCSSTSLPPSWKSFTPLYSGGLCDAEMTTPRPCARRATAGVGSTPPRTAVPPAEATPTATASSSSGPDARVSRPTSTCPPPAQSVAAFATRSTRSGVSSSPTTPLTPSVPKYRRTAADLPLRELRRLAQAGLLALDDAGVAREEALALERHAHLRIGLDERARDAVPDCTRLAGRATAGDAYAEVICRRGLGHLERRHHHLAMHGPWK